VDFKEKKKELMIVRQTYKLFPRKKKKKSGIVLQNCELTDRKKIDLKRAKKNR